MYQISLFQILITAQLIFSYTTTTASITPSQGENRNQTENKLLYLNSVFESEKLLTENFLVEMILSKQMQNQRTGSIISRISINFIMNSTPSLTQSFYSSSKLFQAFLNQVLSKNSDLKIKPITITIFNLHADEAQDSLFQNKSSTQHNNLPPTFKFSYAKFVNIFVFASKSFAPDVLPKFRKAHENYYENAIKPESNYNIFYREQAPIQDDNSDKQNLKSKTKSPPNHHPSILDENFVRNWKHRMEVINSCSLKTQNQNDYCTIHIAYPCFYCQGQGGVTINIIKLRIKFPLNGVFHQDDSSPMKQFKLDFQLVWDNSPDRHLNFRGKTLKVGKGLGLPMIMRHSIDKNGEVTQTGGFQVPILEALERKLNFSSQFSIHRFGALLPNGTYSGLIGKLVSEEVDIGIAAAALFNRYTIIHFMPTNAILYIGFLSRVPSPSVSWNAILKPFTAQLWIFLYAMGLLVVIPIFVFLSLVGGFRQKPAPGPVSLPVNTSNNPWRRDSIHKTVSRVQGPFSARQSISKLFSKGFMFFNKPLIDQNLTSSVQANRTPGQFYMTFWLFTAIIISTAYKSQLLSSIISPTIIRIPESFEELSLSNFEIYMNFIGGALQAVIMSSTSPIFVRIRNKMKVERSLLQCIQRAIESEGVVCIQGKMSLEVEGTRNFTDRYGNPKFKMSPAQGYPFLFSTVTPKHAIYNRRMDTIIQYFIDGGLADKAVRDVPLKSVQEGKIWAKQLSGVKDGMGIKHQNKGLELKNCYIAFMLLLGGSLMSAAVFIGENGVSKSF